MAHARRKFFDLHSAFSSSSETIRNEAKDLALLYKSNRRD